MTSRCLVYEHGPGWSEPGDFFLRSFHGGGYLPREPQDYSRFRYIIIQHVLSPKIQVRIRISSYPNPNPDLNFR